MKTILNFNLPETDEEYTMCLLEHNDYVGEFLEHYKDCSKRPLEFDLEMIGMTVWLLEQTFFEIELSQREKYIRIARDKGTDIKEKIINAVRINRTHSDWYYRLCCVATETIYMDYIDNV